jgi:hypothetical protein
MINEIMEILKKSVEKNGEIPLTNKHLLNILNMVIKNSQIRENEIWEQEPFDDNWGDR